MISVCVAAFNGEKYIEEQILSVLRNLDSQDEIIISDDGSSDRTRRIVDDLAEKDRRIRIIDGPRKGLIKNFENAIVHSKGDIIFLCDQDDVWKDNKVKTVLDIFGNTDCTLVMHDACIVDANLRISGCSFFEFKKCKKGYWRNLIKNSYIGCCMAFKRSIRIMQFLFRIIFQCMISGLDCCRKELEKLSSVTNSFFYIEDIQIMHQK